MRSLGSLKERYDLKLFDGDLLEDSLNPLGLNAYTKDIKITFYILLPFIIMVGIIAYLIKQPARFVADIKNTGRDLLTHLDNQKRGNK